MRQNVLSLFSGAGGAVEGFKNAGYNVVAGVDVNKNCIETLEENHPTTLAIGEDISNTKPEEFESKYGILSDSIDVVVGGPPCKDFSKAQSNRTTKGGRANLIFDFIDYVKYYLPDSFVMENVDALTTIDNGDFFDSILESFDDTEYNIVWDVLEAEKYGVPQKRSRMFLLGSKLTEPSLPEPTTSDYVSVSEALDDLPSLSAGEKSNINSHNAINHRDSTVEKLRDAPNGQSKHPAYARAEEDEPAYTVVPGNCAAPVHHDQPRRITVREMARLQTFSDDYKFVGGRTEKFKRAGNAVPPKLIEEVANELLE